MLWDLNGQPEEVSASVLEALADLLSLLESIDGVLKKKTQPSRRKLSKYLTDGQRPWRERPFGALCKWRIS